MPDSIGQSSLDWALAHVAKFGDTDIFPRPFEIDAIRHGWQTIGRDLAAIDLEAHIVGASNRLLIPKPNGGFRVAIQLDPLDTLLYLGMVHEVAEQLEGTRVPASRRIACSYRIDSQPDGGLFNKENGWPDFQDHSKELAHSGQYSHVLVADVSDFYNQIYHHRLENALSTGGVKPARRASITRFLMQLTAGQSRGLPVGPAASIVLAEMCMHDVDSFLLQQGAVHTRYVDDFRIFCTSEAEARKTFHDLADYLHSAHRLSLEPGKTKILSVAGYIAKEHREPEEEESQEFGLALGSLMFENLEFGNYGEIEDEPEPDVQDLDEAKRIALTNLFEKCVSERPLHLGLARYILRRARTLRIRALVDPVFKNLPVLVPALRDVARYLEAVMRPPSQSWQADALRSLALESEWAAIPFVNTWVSEILRTVSPLNGAKLAAEVASKHPRGQDLRQLALIATDSGELAWTRRYKETWRAMSDWDRRAVIASGRALPEDERKHWLGHVREATRGLDNAVATYTMAPRGGSK